MNIVKILEYSSGDTIKNYIKLCNESLFKAYNLLTINKNKL
jgi:hypothetical protein